MPNVVDRNAGSGVGGDPVNVAERFAPYLDPGEAIVWSGRPPRGLLLRAADVFLIPFSFVWFGGVLFAFAGAIDGRNASGGLFHPVLALFLLVGFYIAFGRFLVDAFSRTRTFYAVTDRRALILGGLKSANIKSMPLQPGLEVSVSGKGRGSVKFGPDVSFSQRAGGHGFGTGQSHPFMFERIDEAQNIYRMVREIQNRNEARRSG